MAGTITQTLERRGPIGVITLTCTADASDGSSPDTVIVPKISGKLLALETNPGSPAPTTLYDIVLDDAEGHDVLEGKGGDRATTATEKVSIVRGIAEYSEVAKSDVLTFKITNNSVNSAPIVAKIYFEGSSEA